MNRNILNFILSDHFLLQGWKRGIDKPLLYKILPFITDSQKGKKVSLVIPSFFSRKEIQVNNGQFLIIITAGQVLKTAFWSNDPNYLISKETSSDFQLIF